MVNKPPSYRILAIVALALAGAGCAHIGPRCRAAQAAAVRPSPSPTPPDPVVGLLTYAHALATKTPAQRADAVRAARKQVHETATAKREARLALALGTPGQRLFTPDQAARYADRALAAGDARWSPAARQYLRGCARLYHKLTSARAAHAKANSVRRIARLRARLATARHKLQALANIEDRLNAASP